MSRMTLCHCATQKDSGFYGLSRVFEQFGNQDTSLAKWQGVKSFFVK
jgi:hypothetical protein